MRHAPILTVLIALSVGCSDDKPAASPHPDGGKSGSSSGSASHTAAPTTEDPEVDTTKPPASNRTGTTTDPDTMPSGVGGGDGPNGEGGSPEVPYVPKKGIGPDAQGVIHVGGAPGEIGEQVGKALGEPAAYLIENWLMKSVSDAGTVASILLFRKSSNMQQWVLPDHLAEMQAVSDTAHIPYEQLALGNAINDAMMIAAGNPLWGCSTYSVTPARSATGRMMVGRNLDYPNSKLLRPRWTPVHYSPTGKLQFLSIAVPGTTGVLTGINEKGVYIAIKISHSGDVNSGGTPAGFIFREILEAAKTAQEAVDMYEKAQRTVPLIVTIADGKDVFEFESDANTYDVRKPDPTTGVLYGANQFESPKLPGGSGEGRDYRWVVQQRHDKDPGKKLSFADLKDQIAAVGGFVEGDNGESNILGVLVNYGASVDDTVLTWGADPDNIGVSMRGPVHEIRLGDVFTK